MPFDTAGQGEFQERVFRRSWVPGLSTSLRTLLNRIGKSPVQPGIQVPFPQIPDRELRRPVVAGRFVGGQSGGGGTTIDDDGSSSSGSSDSGSSDSGDGSGSSSSDSGASSSSDSSGSMSSSAGSGSSSGISSGDEGSDGSEGSDSASSGSPACLWDCPFEVGDYSGISWNNDPECEGVCPELSADGKPLCSWAKLGDCVSELCQSNGSGIIPCCNEDPPPPGCLNACGCCYFTGVVELSTSYCCNCP